VKIVVTCLLVLALIVPVLAQEPVQPTGEGTVGLKMDVSQPNKVAEHFKQHWWKYLGIAALGYTADRVADNNDWWWHDSKEKSPSVGGDINQSQATTETENVNVTVSGNEGDVRVEINYKTGGGE